MLNDSNDMESISDDLGIGKPSSDHLAIGRREVNKDHLDLISTEKNGHGIL